jgi:hypothetical protein
MKEVRDHWNNRIEQNKIRRKRKRKKVHRFNKIRVEVKSRVLKINITDQNQDQNRNHKKVYRALENRSNLPKAIRSKRVEVEVKVKEAKNIILKKVLRVQNYKNKMKSK